MVSDTTMKQKYFLPVSTQLLIAKCDDAVLRSEESRSFLCFYIYLLFCRRFYI